jgi:hypothetical protein
MQQQTQNQLTRKGRASYPYFERRWHASDRVRPDGEPARLDPQSRPWLRIERLDELAEHEQRILVLIASIRNGGLLFMTHPFRLLEDLGVALSDTARKEAVERIPELGVLSDMAYEAAREAARASSVTVYLHGLFPPADEVKS